MYAYIKCNTLPPILTYLVLVSISFIVCGVNSKLSERAVDDVLEYPAAVSEVE